MWSAAGDPGLTPLQYWGGQAVLVLVALIGAWYALRGKRVDRSTKGDELQDARLARSEARRDAELEYLDRELTEARSDNRALRASLSDLWDENDALRRALRRAGVELPPELADGGRHRQ